jgi:serine/threonine protein kinase
MNYGRYQIVKELGRGAMGIVYQAHDPEIGRSIAVKVLREDRMTTEAFVQRFLKEARAIGRLSHPNIVTVYDIGQDRGTVYIAMEFLEGEPLDKVIERKKFSFEDIVDLGLQMGEALHYAHQRGIVHRDVKPSNIIIQPTGRIKITDFGIAHIEDPTASIQTQAGEILGTPAYMSPQQATSQPLDGRSDLFSLGVILYELATGGRPFLGKNLAAIFHSVTHDHPPPPADINPEVPLNLSQIIMKCLNKDPEERYATGEALAEDLEKCLAKRESGPAEESAASLKGKKKKKGIVILIAAVTIAGVIGGLSYYLTIPEKKTSSAIAKPEILPKVEKVKTALLKVESTPVGAQIFVDSQFQGNTPAQLELPAGKHEVRLTLHNYHEWEAQVQLNEEGETPLQVRLIPIAEKKL